MDRESKQSVRDKSRRPIQPHAGRYFTCLSLGVELDGLTKQVR